MYETIVYLFAPRSLKLSTLAIVFMITLMFSQEGSANGTLSVQLPSSVQGVLGAEFSVFEPSAREMTVPIDYNGADILLQAIVVDFGVSLRQPVLPSTLIGSHFKVGIKGDAALEGGRVAFS